MPERAGAGGWRGVGASPAPRAGVEVDVIGVLLDAGVVAWSARHVAAWLCLLLLASYALVRGWLHRRYA